MPINQSNNHIDEKPAGHGRIEVPPKPRSRSVGAVSQLKSSKLPTTIGKPAQYAGKAKTREESKDIVNVVKDNGTNGVNQDHDDRHNKTEKSEKKKDKKREKETVGVEEKKKEIIKANVQTPSCNALIAANTSIHQSGDGNFMATTKPAVKGTTMENREQMLLWELSDIIPRLVAPFLSFHDILIIRRMNRVMYFNRRYRLINVALTPFAFVGQSAMWHYVVPTAIKACTPGALQKINFKGCTMLSDQFYRALFSDATIFPSTLLSITTTSSVPQVEDAKALGDTKNGIGDESGSQGAGEQLGGKSTYIEGVPDQVPPSIKSKELHCSLKVLLLDFCPQVTDKTLAQLLTINFPRLEKLSFKCVRSNMLTGEPFIRLLDKFKWPRFHQLDSSFTHMTLQALDLASSFALARAIDIGTTPSISIAGSLASIAFFKVLGLDQVHNSFRETVEQGDTEALSKNVKYFEQAYSSQVDSPGLKRMILCRLLRHHATRLLVNAPLTTAVAAEKKRKEEIVNKAKKQAVIDETVGDDAAPSDVVEDLWRGINIRTTSGIEMSEPSTTNQQNVQPPEPKKTVSKDVSSSVTRWTYPIYTAVRRGHRQTVEYLMKNGAVYDIVDYDGSSPLHVAATFACQASTSSLAGNGGEMINKDGDQDEVTRRGNIVKLLLSWGCNVNALDVNSRRWPINAAAKYDNAALIKTFTESGARVNFPGRIYGNMAGEAGPKGPLLVACEADPPSRRAIRALLEAGADVVGMSSKTRCSGASPILTVYRKDQKMVELFLSKIPESKIILKDNLVFEVLSELLSTAVYKNDQATCSLLISKIPELLKREHSIWSYPIHQVTRLQQSDVMEEFIAAYLMHGWTSFLNDSDNAGRTPLMNASLDNSINGVQALLNHNVDVNTLDHNGLTALMMACENNHWAVANMLLKHGADPNLRNTEDGYTALMLVIISRQERIALKLIDGRDDYKINLNIVDNEGRSALMIACLFGMFKVSQELISKGVNVNLIDANGDTAESILKKKIEIASGTVQGFYNSMQRKLGKLSRMGRGDRDKSLSSRLSRRGTDRCEDTDEGPLSSDRQERPRTSLAASELIRFDAALSCNEGDNGKIGLHDDEMMRDLQDRTKKAALKLMKQLKEISRGQELSPDQRGDRSIKRKSSGTSSISSTHSRRSRQSRSESQIG